ncbi:arginase family protein [Flagellimonas meridianipacifica]|uniref:Arginase n=1 Tax=Flagellimonas meridianipacifica TaxID=1080225 RepID=A0A2T0MA35_9FLAO|nr:arginase family protein [Allomuricauda pacifica]PRX54339.1 arginase [Allomuricauda pacifica]
MKIYFPQWQGAGTGEKIEDGAFEVLQYLDDPDFVKIPLSNIPAGKNGEQRFNINNYDAITEQLSRFKEFLEKEQPTQLATIGGDCGLEIVPVSYLNAKYSNFGVIWFDAHADINKPCDSPSCNFHGMPLRTLLGEGESKMDGLMFSNLVSSQIHYIGLRDIDAAEKIRLEEGNIYHPSKVNIIELIETLKGKGIQNLYLHFDFDCLEPNDYDKTYYNVPNGVTINEALTCIEALQSNFNVVGTSVLESITAQTDDLVPIHAILNTLMK